MASASPPIQDVTAENFRQLVLENSEKSPVLVYYWSPRAEPCLALMPRLAKLAEEFGGRFQLVRLNTDEYGPLAREHGVVSVPTTKIFQHGRDIDTLNGAESDANLRQFINRRLPRPTSALHVRALEAYRSGNIDRAVSLAAEAVLANPEDTRIPLDLAKLLMLGGRFEQADELLRCLPNPAKNQPEIRNLAAHLGFIRESQNAPPIGVLEDTVAADPGDLPARYQLAAAKVVRDDYEAAIVQLLEIVRRDPRFRDGAGRNGLLAIFDMLGPDDERVSRHRAALTDALH